MSQAIRALKSIASQPEYKSLAEAIEVADYDKVCQSYVQVSELLRKAKTEILDKIQSLPRRNKDEDCQSFLAAVAAHQVSILPQWHWLDSLLKEQRIFEGEVVGFGSKGDPLAKTSEGKIVVLAGSALTKDSKVALQVTGQGRNVNFGKVFEFTSDSLYQIVRRDILGRIRISLDSVKQRIPECLVHPVEEGFTKLSDLLTRLEEIRGLASRLRAEDREKVLDRILAYRKKLLSEVGVSLIFELLSREEETDIRESCQGDEQRTALALSAPGILRHKAHEALKAELFAGEDLRKCVEIQQKLKAGPYSLDTDLELAGLKWRTEKVYPASERYMEKIEALYTRFYERAQKVAYVIAEDRICGIEDIRRTFRQAFSDVYIATELRQVFQSMDEYRSLRADLAELRSVLGDEKSLAAESALQPYLEKRWQATLNV